MKEVSVNKCKEEQQLEQQMLKSRQRLGARSTLRRRQPYCLEMTAMVAFMNSIQKATIFKKTKDAELIMVI